ncbi:MAG: cytochrome b N-terminal domain-containing protein [Nitrososphaerales archaeon]
MAEKYKDKNLILKLTLWIIDRLERTVFLGFRFTFPRKFLSPMGFSGMLTFSTFVVLGITGAVLMLFYQPGIEGAFDSVRLIEEEIPLGFAIRNIHYHASNAMVFLAVLHLYYQYFSGRYKIRNEIIWVTGLILGVVTVLEAFSGYDLIFNDRAELAISIGVGLTVFSPVIGPQLAAFIWGSGFSDFLLRLYALHVFTIPLVMAVLMFFHFPRFLVFDIPLLTATTGIIMLTGGIFPVDLGVKFDPNVPPGLTVPEWYLTGLYAFIRTGFDKFVTGGLLPALLILMFLVVPFIDTGRKFSWKDRPFFTALGLGSIAQILVATVWGFYINPDPTLPTVERLLVDPVPLFSIMLVGLLISFAITYGFLKARVVFGSKKRTFTKPVPISLSSRWTATIIAALLGTQVLLNVLAIQALNNGLLNLALFEVGAVFLVFAAVFHVYRAAKPELPKTKPQELPKPTPVATKTPPPAPAPVIARAVERDSTSE